MSFRGSVTGPVSLNDIRGWGGIKAEDIVLSCWANPFLDQWQSADALRNKQNRLYMQR